MNLLLDSHAFLWWLAEDPKLSAEAKQAVSDPSSIVYISAATVWELSIKAALGKLDLDGADLVEEIEQNAFFANSAATVPEESDRAQTTLRAVSSIIPPCVASLAWR